MYDEMMVKPMREELTSAGVEELRSSDDVESLMKAGAKTKIIFVNSVCGCAAGSARPGFISSLNNSVVPEKIATVFAGVDKDAVESARGYFLGYPPSSPAIAVFRGDELVHMIERHDIEGNSAAVIDKTLRSVYEKYCGDAVREDIQIFDAKSALQISVKEVKDLMANGANFKFLDCRDEHERDQANIEGTTLITQTLAEEMIKTWDKSTSLVIHCHHGSRSLQAAQYFQHHGFSNVKSMTGGIARWSTDIDSSIPQY